MTTTIKNPLARPDSLPNLHPRRTTSPVKSTFSTDSSDILSAAVLHKRRPRKRVRFALKLAPVEEDSIPSSRENSSSVVSKSSSRIIDPWRQEGPLYGAYVEYLEKQDALITTESSVRRSPPPPPPPAPEPGAEPPTYTHTFVIQSKSPEVVINSITVSSPSFHLPHILHQTKKINKHPLPALDSYVKQQLTLSTAPRMMHSKKLLSTYNPKTHYAHVQAALKRAELSIPSTNGLHANNRVTRTEHLCGTKFLNDPNQPKKIPEVNTRPIPSVNNHINHFSDRSILPNYSKKARVHSRTLRMNEEVNSNAPYFFQNHDSDQLLQPTIHSTH